MHFKNDVQHNIGGFNLFDIEFMKEFQIIKGPLKVNNLITSKIDKYKIRTILFCRNNIGVENKDPRMCV